MSLQNYATVILSYFRSGNLLQRGRIQTIKFSVLNEIESMHQVGNEVVRFKRDIRYDRASTSTSTALRDCFMFPSYLRSIATLLFLARLTRLVLSNLAHDVAKQIKWKGTVAVIPPRTDFAARTSVPLISTQLLLLCQSFHNPQLAFV